MLMPVEVYNKTEGEQWIDTKKTKGKLYFLWGRTAFTVKVRSKVIQEILRRNWKKETGKNYKEREKQLKDNFEASEGKWRKRGKKTQCK